MILKKKTLRYYYWLMLEFAKKHVKLITLSFLLTFFVIISFISFSPYFASFFFARRDVIGIVGNYTIGELPDEIITKISHGLINFDQNGSLIPALASSWEITDGGRQFRFHIKQNLYWDDNKLFTAHDINYHFADVETKVVDDNTIHFILKKPLPIFPSFLNKPITRFPLHGVVGLYKVDQIKESFGRVNEISLTPNKSTLPHTTYKFYKTEGDMINAYKLGQISQMKINKKSLADSLRAWKNTKVEKSVDYTQALTLFFNTSSPILKEKEVRQAIAQSIPQEDIADLGEIATSPIPPTSWAYNPGLKRIVYNPDIAKKKLEPYSDASGSAVLNFQTSYEYFDIASRVNDSLQKAGLKTKLNLDVFRDIGGFDMLLAFWKVPQDPDQYFFWHSTQKQGNITGYKNGKIHKLLEDGRNTLAIEKRKKIYYDFQKVFMDDLPAVFLYYPNVYTISRK